MIRYNSVTMAAMFSPFIERTTSGEKKPTVKLYIICLDPRFDCLKNTLRIRL